MNPPVIASAATPEETHPLEPFFPEGAKVLMCGTFPPQRSRWSMDFYYPNFINDMWRIFGLIYTGDPATFVDKEHSTFYLPEIKALLTEKGIALNDTGKNVVRTMGNASDKFLDIKEHIDLDAALRALPECHTLALTGKLAAEVAAGITGCALPKQGEYSDCEFPLSDGSVRSLRVWRMPSSSRAYPMKLEKKAEAYRRMLLDAGAL